MTKATHEGTCQACGRYQKLPNGELSNHGYTVQWNMFEGTCPGSKELPYEIDNSLVKKYIVDAKYSIVSLNENIKEVKSLTDSKNVWKLEGRYWKRRELVAEEFHYEDDDISYFKFKWVYSDEELEGKRSYELRHLTEACLYQHFTSIDEAVKFENEKYMRYLLGRIDSLNSYIEWQEERVANWKPKELVAIEKTYSGPKVHVVNARDIRIEDGKVKYKARQKSGCGRSEYFSKVSEFGKVYKESPEKCCKGCVKRFLEIKEVIAKRKEEAL